MRSIIRLIEKAPGSSYGSCLARVNRRIGPCRPSRRTPGLQWNQLSSQRVQIRQSNGRELIFTRLGGLDKLSPMTQSSTRYSQKSNVVGPSTHRSANRPCQWAASTRLQEKFSAVVFTT